MIRNNIDVKINVIKLVDNSYDMDTFKEKLINLIVEKVTSYFEGHEYVFEKSVPINIMTKEELDKFLISIDKQFENNVVPEWIKGFSCELGVYLVLSGNDEKYAGLSKEDLPKTENLIDTIDRVLVYWNEEIKPAIESGKNVIIAAHGNSLRALIKYLDNISDDEIVGVEVQTGNPICYELDDNLKPIRHYYVKD